MSADGIRSILQDAPATSAELSAALGCTPRHVRRLIADMGDVQAVRVGRSIVYTTTTADPAAAGPDRAAPAVPLSAAGGHSGHSGHTADITGHDAPHDPSSSPQRAAIGDPPPGGYGKPGDVGTHSGPRPRPSPQRGRSPCRTCPLTAGDIEHDQIQFVVMDQDLADTLPDLARAQGWPIRHARGTWWISAAPALTLQVPASGDTVTFYSSDPAGANIPAWVRTHLRGHHPDPEGLAAAVRRPHMLTRDELTVVVTDAATRSAVRAVLRGQFERDGTHRRPAPNAATPGLKIYERDGTTRVETDARNHYQATTAIIVRQELLTILPDLADRPGLLSSWISRWWGPDSRPVLIDTQDLAAAITAEMQPQQTGPPDRAAPAGDTTADRDTLGAILADLDAWSIDQAVQSLAQHLRMTTTAAKVYLAAFSSWAASNYRAPVLFEDVAHLLRDEDPPPSVDDVRAACTECEARGLMTPDRRLDIRISPAGVRLGKKLVAMRE